MCENGELIDDDDGVLGVFLPLLIEDERKFSRMLWNFW